MHPHRIERGDRCCSATTPFKVLSTLRAKGRPEPALSAVPGIGEAYGMWKYGFQGFAAAGKCANAATDAAGWPRLSRFGLYRSGAAGRGLPRGIVSRVNLLCLRTQVGGVAQTLL